MNQLVKIKYVRPALAQYQLDAMFNTCRFSCIEATSKAGKTVSAMAWLVEEALKLNNGYFWWFAPSYRQAKIPYERLKATLPSEIATPKDTELTITLSNGSVLRFMGADNSDLIYGFEANAAVVDEASRIREESWFAIKSLLVPTNGPARLIGNVAGTHNWFYQLCRKVESGLLPGYYYAKITCYDAIKAGIISAETIEDAKNTLPENVFRELYLAEASEDGSNPFGINAIRDASTYISEGIRYPRELSKLPPVCFGIDLGRSVDYTSITGLDQHGAMCYHDRFKLDWEITIKKILDCVGNIPTLVDSTGVGDSIAERLHRTRSNIEGFHFSSSSKQSIMENLALGLQNGQARIPYDGPTRPELEAYEFEYTRTGIRYVSRIHDDTVCSLALAWRSYSKPKNMYLLDLMMEDGI